MTRYDFGGQDTVYRMWVQSQENRLHSTLTYQSDKHFRAEHCFGAGAAVSVSDGEEEDGGSSSPELEREFHYQDDFEEDDDDAEGS